MESYRIKERIDEVYMETLDELEGSVIDAEEAKVKVALLKELHEERIAEQKLDIDALAKEKELELKREEVKEKKKDSVLRNVIEAAGIVLPIIATSVWMAITLKFEEDGTFTTKTPRFVNDQNRLFRK